MSEDIFGESQISCQDRTSRIPSLAEPLSTSYAPRQMSLLSTCYMPSCSLSHLCAKSAPYLYQGPSGCLANVLQNNRYHTGMVRSGTMGLKQLQPLESDDISELSPRHARNGLSTMPLAQVMYNQQCEAGCRWAYSPVEPETASNSPHQLGHLSSRSTL